jgi:hypothetical protein
MARVRGDKRQIGFLIVLFFVATVYALWSLVAAATTADACEGERLDAPKEWRFVPPGWECDRP